MLWEDTRDGPRFNDSLTAITIYTAIPGDGLPLSLQMRASSAHHEG